MGQTLAGLVVVVSLLVAVPAAAEAQQPGKVYRIGVLAEEPAETYMKRRPELRSATEALRLGLQEHGWIENQNFTFVRRHTEGKAERYPIAATELAALQPDVIVTALGEPAIQALKNATTKIPIVMLVSADPVGARFATSLARPGGNITGMSILAPDTGAKRLELLKKAIPHATRVAVLWNEAYPIKTTELRHTEEAAARLKIRLHPIAIRDAADLPRAFSMITSHSPDALVVFSDPLTVSNLRQIVEYAAVQRLPLVSEVREFAERGGLMTYGANLADLIRGASRHVDKILKGAKPADLPIEQPTKFELVINLATAKALGLAVPRVLILQADQVIQ